VASGFGRTNARSTGREQTQSRVASGFSRTNRGAVAADGGAGGYPKCVRMNRTFST
jgi:hypothetical protein